MRASRLLSIQMMLETRGPMSAAALAEALEISVRTLHRDMALTVVMVTHDLDTLFELSTRIAVLADKKVVAVGTIAELLALDHPWIQEYFNGPRGRAAADSYEQEVTA